MPILQILSISMSSWLKAIESFDSIRFNPPQGQRDKRLEANQSYSSSLLVPFAIEDPITSLSR